MQKRILPYLVFALSILGLILANCGGGYTPVENPISSLPAFTPLAAATSTPSPEKVVRDLHGCQRAGSERDKEVLDFELGICFLYPASFTPSPEPGENARLTLAGPQYSSDDGISQAVLEIAAHPASDLTLEGALDQAIAAYKDAHIVETLVEIEDLPAYILDDIPARLPMRQALFLANGYLVVISLTPAGEQYPQANADAEMAWHRVLTTIHIFPPDPTAMQQITPGQDGWTYQALDEVGIHLRIPPGWSVAHDQPGVYGLAPMTSFDTHLITLSTLPDLTATSIIELIPALQAYLENRGEELGAYQEITSGGQPALSRLEQAEYCRQIYIPGNNLVREIRLQYILCNTQGELSDPAIQQVLDTIQLVEPVQ